MAKIVSLGSMDMTGLDFHYVGTYATGVVDKGTAIVDGVSYGSVVEVDWSYGGVAYAALLAGSGIVASFANHTLSITAGTVGGFFLGYPGSAGTVLLSFGIENISYSAVSLGNLIHTVGNSDDAAFVASVLTGNDTIQGSAYTDVLFGNGGDDFISGGGGVDAVFYRGDVGHYVVTNNNGTITVADTVAGRDGTDTLTGVEQIYFTDYALSFDLSSTQDLEVYEIYQAAYGRTPDNAGFRYWAGVADANQMSATAIADQFIAAAEFTQVYGANPSNTTYVAGLYTHVLGRTPDQAGLDYWVGVANGGMAKDALLVAFATSAENGNIIGPHASLAHGFWATL